MPTHEIGPIFIFASGQRCGSTLLQRFLCSHPDILIWGEHDGVLEKVFKQFDRLLKWEEMFGHQFQTYLNDGYDNFIPNMNPYREDIYNSLIHLAQNLWQAPAKKLDKSIWGFKEVLYGADMAFRLKQLFPNTKIIHLTRNIFDCFISLRHEETIPPEKQPHVPIEQVWTRARTLEFIETWIRVNRSLLETPGLDADWVFHCTYEQLTDHSTGIVETLINWLGLRITDFDFDVFKHKLYTDRHKGEDPRPRVKRADLSQDEIALVTTQEILRISRQLNYDMSVTG